MSDPPPPPEEEEEPEDGNPRMKFAGAIGSTWVGRLEEPGIS